MLLESRAILLTDCHHSIFIGNEVDKLRLGCWLGEQITTLAF